MFKTRAKPHEPASSKKNKTSSIGKYTDARGEKLESKLSISGKFYGQLQVTKPRCDAACETALALIKARALVSKTRKPRVTIELQPSRFLVKQANNILHSFAYTDMAFIWSDPCDNRTCGLVFRRTDLGDNLYEFYGYKVERGPSQLIGALKLMFLNLPTNSIMENEIKAVMNEDNVARAVPTEQIKDEPQPKAEGEKKLFVQDLLDLEEQLDTHMVEHWSSFNTDKTQIGKTLLESARQSQKPDCSVSKTDSSWAVFDDPFELEVATTSGLPGTQSWTDSRPLAHEDMFFDESFSKSTAQAPCVPPPVVGNEWGFQWNKQSSSTHPNWPNAASVAATPEVTWIPSSRDFEVHPTDAFRNQTLPQQPNPFVNSLSVFEEPQQRLQQQQQQEIRIPSLNGFPPPLSSPFQFPCQFPMESTFPAKWF